MNIPLNVSPVVKNCIEAYTAAHSANQAEVDNMESLQASIAHCRQQKEESQNLSQQTTSQWRTKFRQLRGNMTEDMKKQHIERVAQREMVQEMDHLLAELDIERQRMILRCTSTGKALISAHNSALLAYSKEEFYSKLEQLSEPLVRAIALRLHALSSASNESEAGLSYVKPEIAVVNDLIEYTLEKAKTYVFDMVNEPVLDVIKLSSPSTPYLDTHLLRSPASCMKLAKALTEQEAALNAKREQHI